ncbi:hypothetical protein HZH66_003442 [Vespula vulgaris]|uniref:Uncharacterized protein n=1 Tax=Vespula vulgaris TaxID=7454 RepID=A0A834KI84_VESVU|nr:hypothetical protein HZH66_003442 [Vespula vulgaris]
MSLEIIERSSGLNENHSMNRLNKFIIHVADEYNLIRMPSIEFTKEDVAKATKRSSNWKAPGSDYLQNY